MRFIEERFRTDNKDGFPWSNDQLHGVEIGVTTHFVSMLFKYPAFGGMGLTYSNFGKRTGVSIAAGLVVEHLKLWPT